MPPSDPPNVLWVTTDQQRYDALGCYGAGHAETPAIDDLAERGTRFERAYCQSPVCTPSRASFLTGRYPRTCGVRQNGQPIPDEEVLVTRLLAAAGYDCGLAGKLHLSPADRASLESKAGSEPYRRPEDGYVEFHWSHSPSDPTPANQYRQWLRRRDVAYDPEPVGEGYVREGPPAEHHQTTWCAERAIDFLTARAGDTDPWLFSLNLFDPHPAFEAPREYLDRYRDRLDDLPAPNYEPGELDAKPVFQREKHRGANNRPGTCVFAEMDAEDHLLVRAAYWAMCDLIDDQVARVLAALEETGQREDTLVIYTADHGEMLGDHGIYYKGPYFYEPAVRVPLIVDGPGVAARTESGLVELLDLAPTLCAAAGIEPHPGMQGQSLWPALAGSDRSATRDSVYCEFYNASTQHTDPPAYATMLRTDRYKLVRVHGREEGELYDLETDPDETENLWEDPDRESVRSDLTARLADRMAFAADPLPERRGRW
jgi:choline-sulfatase